MSKWGQNNGREEQSADISTLLGKDAEIRGTIRTQSCIRVDGSIIGELISSKTVTIGATGSVDGNVSAENVIIAGKVKGTVTARGKVALESSAQLDGDLQASRLSISEGAAFKGRSNMGAAAQSALRHTDGKAVEDAPRPADKVVAA